MTTSRYYNPNDVDHLPDHYPKLRCRALGPFASSVMLLASRVPLYMDGELDHEKALDAAAAELGMVRE